MFGIVVIPRNSVVTQESEKGVAVFLESLFAFRSSFTCEIRFLEKSIKAIYILYMFPEEVFFQSTLIDGFTPLKSFSKS